MTRIEERPSPLERLSTALGSDDLSVVERSRKDIDYIIALGCIGNRNKNASALLHVELAGSRVSFREAKQAAINITRNLDAKRDWKLGGQDIKDVAATAIKMWLVPVCSKCEGRKYQNMPGTPMLSTAVCSRCHGTGKQPYPIRHGC